MFQDFFRFELRYWLRGWMVWIFLAVIALMIFGAVSSDTVTVGGSIGNTLRNAPFVIENYYSIIAILTLLMTTAFSNAAAVRDFQHNTHQMLFSLPVRKWHYLFGRFFGSSVAALIPALGVSIGALLAKYAPWVDAERFGPVSWAAHWHGIVVFAIPNTLFIAAILFAVAALFRSTTVSFLAALLLLVATGVTAALTTDMKNETLASLIDPFGTVAFNIATKYWTAADRNTMSLGWTGLLLANRLIWLSVGALVFFAACSRVRMGEQPQRKKKAAQADEEAPMPQGIALPNARASWSGNARLAQYLGSFRMEFRSLIKSPVFVVLLAAGALNCGVSLWASSGEGFGNKTFPVTYWVIEIIQGTLYMFLLSMLTYFAGQLVWRERDDRVDELQDSTPMADWLLYAAKLSVLLVAVFAVLVLAMGVGITVQALRGYTHFQLDQYVTEMLLRDYTTLLFLGVLAFFCHVVAPNKYIGYFVFIAYLILDTFAWEHLDVASRMVSFAARPEITYSDFYGHAPDWWGWGWMTLYWALFCGILAVASILLWRRGKDASLQQRLRIAGLRLRGGLRAAAVAVAFGFLATGAWAYYNTKVLNTVIGPQEIKKRGAELEKLYKKYENMPRPRITAVKYEIDVFPERRDMDMRGETTLVNKTNGPIAEMHMMLNPDYRYEISMPGMELKNDDKRLAYRIYALRPPMEPGQSAQLRFTVKGVTKGFANSVRRTEIVQNGTFFNSAVAPQIGYRADRELEDRNERRKRGLKEKDTMPALQRNCTADCTDHYLGDNSDWVSVETVISTSPDQIAVAPGSLVREWQENGRRYFQYRLDHDSLNFYSFISARYEVKRDLWNDVKLEVYHLPEHKDNVPRMIDSMKKTLAYCTANFSPYTHKQARIIEFPRVARFAQAFPGTMPYSESIGFIADLRDKESIDHVFYVVAHEMGHQWWAHQLVGARMQGATLLSETMSQYTALMVMEKEYGRDMMRKFLEYESDRYLRSRGREVLKERPLLKVEAQQGYTHYNKGSVVLYQLKETIGEDKVNFALRKLLDKYAYTQPPYPTSWDWLDAFREVTPPEYQSLLKDLIEEITLFSNRTLEATARKLPSGQYEVTVKAETKKFKADEKGAEKEVAVNDWIEIGAFAKPPEGKKYGKTLYRTRLQVNAAAVEHKFTVGELPEKAGIDPFHLLIDRVPDDNTKAVDIKN